MVMQQSPFIKRLKCTCAYGGWSIFTEKCTPDVTFTSIRNPYMSKCILLPKMKRSNKPKPSFPDRESLEDFFS